MPQLLPQNFNVHISMSFFFFFKLGSELKKSSKDGGVTGFFI